MEEDGLIETGVRTKEDFISLWKIWKNWVDHLVAPLILLALVILAQALIIDNQLKNDILTSDHCGYYDTKEKIQCYCNKNDVAEILAKLDPTTLRLPVITNSSGGFEPYVFSFQNKTSVEN